MSDAIRRSGDWWIETGDDAWKKWSGERWEQQPDPAPPPRRLARLWLVAKSVGMPTLLVTIIALLFTCKPNWVSPAERSVAMDGMGIERAVTLSQYASHRSVAAYLTGKGMRLGADDTDGLVVHFNYKLSGFRKKNQVLMRWTLLDGLDRRVQESEQADPISRKLRQLGQPPFTLQANLRGVDVGSWEVWIDTSTLPSGSYLVRLELYDPNTSQRWAFKDTKPFSVRSAREDPGATPVAGSA